MERLWGRHMELAVVPCGYAKKVAIQYGATNIKSITTNETNDGILFTLVDDTTYNIPLSSLAFLLESDLSSSLTSTSTLTPANSNAVKLTNDKFADYILKTSITDSIVGTDSTLVASSKAVGDLNIAKVNTTDIATTIVNNPDKVASASIVYTVNNDLTTNYIPNTKKSNSINSESTSDVATSKAVFDTIDYLEGNLLAKADLTSDYTGQSTTLGLSQKGGYLLKSLISSAISGLTYIGSISATNFKTMTIWKQGDMYKASEDIEVGTTAISKNALIIMKTSSVEGGTAVIKDTDFDAFMSAMDFSHTPAEIDQATTMTLDTQFTKLGWVDIENCTLTTNDATRTITVGIANGAESTHLYINGTKLIMDEEVSITFDETATTFYVIMSEAKVLSVVNTIDYNDYSNMPICFVRWNNVNQTLTAMFDLRVHNLLMDVPTRSYIYSNGMQWQTGFELSNFAQGDTDSQICCQFDISGGQVRQSEKLLTYTSNSIPSKAYENNMSPFNSRLYYISGSSYTQTAVSDTPLKMGTNFPYYNKNTDNTWSLAEPTEGQYFPVFIGVSTDIRAGCSAISVMGQNVYDSLEDCVNATKLNADMLADLETRNFRFLYVVYYHCSATYTNMYHAKAVKYTDIRKSTLIPVVNGNTSTSTGSSLTKVDVTTADFFTAQQNRLYYLKTGAVGAEITLPNTNIKVQDQVVISDVGGVLGYGSIVTVNGTTATINGQANNLILNVKNATVTFEWTGSTWLFKADGTLVTPVYNETLDLIPSTTTQASMNIPTSGVAPTSPNEGDIFVDNGVLTWKKSIIYGNEPLSTPMGTKAERLALSGVSNGYSFFQTDGIVGLYRYANGWLYEGESSWYTYTPTIGTYSGTSPTYATTRTLQGLYKIAGKTLHMKYLYHASSTSGATNGSGVYTFSIPSNLTIDTILAKIPTSISSSNGNYAGVNGTVLGFGVAGGSLAYANVSVVPLSETSLGLYMNGSSDNNYNNTLVGSVCSIVSTNRYYKFTAEIPLTAV